MRKFNLEKLNKISIALLVIGIGVGILITAQWRTKPTRVSDPISPYLSLRDTRDKLSKDQLIYKDQIKNLQTQIDDAQQQLKKYRSNKAQVEESEKDRAAIGLTEVKGDGVVITMNDSDNAVITIDSITHAADLRDLVNFLWRSGAENISINEERIIFFTSIDCIVNTILINSTKTTPPFTIKAIGNSDKLSEELNNKNNLKDINKRVEDEGLVFNFTKEKDITILAYTGTYKIEKTKIVQ